MCAQLLSLRSLFPRPTPTLPHLPSLSLRTTLVIARLPSNKVIHSPPSPLTPFSEVVDLADLALEKGSNCIESCLLHCMKKYVQEPLLSSVLQRSSTGGGRPSSSESVFSFEPLLSSSILAIFPRPPLSLVEPAHGPAASRYLRSLLFLVQATSGI